MRTFKLVVLAAACMASLGAAASAMASMALPIGWYIEGNVGSTRVSSVNYGSGLASSTSGVGYNANAGYKFMPYFGMEVGYTKYAKSKVKSNGTSVANVTDYSYDLAGKGILPISDSGVDLFAKVGIARVNSHVVISNTSYVYANGISVNSGSRGVTGAYFGFGGDYNFMPNMAMNLQWERAKGSSSTGNLDLYSIGLSYIFG